jgi:hypothetical protein
VPTLAPEERDAMLHENPLMLDIDVNHWRNLQTLLLDSAKERRRIVIIHDGGEILKFVHSHREPVVKSVTRVDDPHATAEKVYDDNAGNVDFVAVFERSAFDEYFGRFQATWKPDEDLDEFVHRTYALLDAYPDGIVTYPGPARNVLGLQWRLGATRDQIVDAAKKFVPPGSTVVFGIFADGDLWATLVLRFDADLRIDVVTTVDPSQLIASVSTAAAAEEVVSWVNRRYPPCSVGLFTTLEHARAFLEREDKLVCLRELAEREELIASPVPDGLRSITLAAAQ